MLEYYLLIGMPLYNDFDPASTIQQALADKNSKLLKVIALASATKRQSPL